ncbi:hypothetical protein [Photobacterium sp. DNB22_13_2]
MFFVKGTGERIGELSESDKAGCILRIDDEAQGYRIWWGMSEGVSNGDM